MFSGVIARNVGQPLGFYPVGRFLSLAVGRTRSRVRVSLRALRVRPARAACGRASTIRATRSCDSSRWGTIFFLAAIAFVAAQGVWLAGHVETAVPVSLTEPFYFAALYGFLLAWIYGFGNRVVSMFLGVGPARRGTPEATLLLQAAAVPVFFASYLPWSKLPTALLLRDAGLGLAALSALVYLAGNGFLWRRPTFPAMRAPGSPTVAIRCAFGCLALWAVLELAASCSRARPRFPRRTSGGPTRRGTCSRSAS